MALLFVYGTLKRGCRNHRELVGQRHVGDARTGPGFALYNLGDYPGLVPDPAAGEPIRGELWEIDDDAWARLDRFEGVGEGLYSRDEITLAEPAGTHAFTYLYRLPCSTYPRLGGIWRE